MIVLNNDQLKAISGICINAGNIIFTGTVVSHFVPAYAGSLNLKLSFIGFVISICAWSLGIVILREEDSE